MFRLSSDSAIDIISVPPEALKSIESGPSDLWVSVLLFSRIHTRRWMYSGSKMRFKWVFTTVATVIEGFCTKGTAISMCHHGD